MLAALALVVRRPPRTLRRAWPGQPGPVAGPLRGRAVAGPVAAGTAAARHLPPAGDGRRAGHPVLGGWAGDVVKASAIQTVFAAAAGAAVVAATRRFPRSWWAPWRPGRWCSARGLAALAPVVLDPIFNDFEPLPEGETALRRAGPGPRGGVKVGEVYSVDASRRTTAANAYVTGLGPTKRVVLFDTLLDRYSRDEVRLVVAHELAHVRHRDVPRGLPTRRSWRPRRRWRCSG